VAVEESSPLAEEAVAAEMVEEMVEETAAVIRP
jgi:hypothetical protein